MNYEAGVADRVSRVAQGTYLVDRDGRSVVVYVTGTTDNWWAFCEGEVYRTAPRVEPRKRSRAAGSLATEVTAPMPATVVAVNVTAGSTVKKGDILVVLDAMKMEMPLRADADATVKAVRCTPGELVQADAILIELE